MKKNGHSHIASTDNINSNNTLILKKSKGKIKNDIIIKLTKTQNNSKKTEIPILIGKKPLYFFEKKTKSPKKRMNYMSSININNSNGELNNITLPLNNLRNSHRNQKELKSIYLHSNMTGLYSKPKGLCKEKKYIGISPKILFKKVK